MLSCCVGLFSTPTSAQLDSTIYVQFDRPFYLAGEEVYFRIYAPGLKKFDHTLVQMTLTSPSIDTIFRPWYLLLTEGSGFGSLVLPYDRSLRRLVLSGQVFDITKQMFSTIFCHDIQVVNPENAGRMQLEIMPEQLGDLNVDLHIKGDAYHPGDSLNIQITLQEVQEEVQDYDLSISVSFQPYVMDIIPRNFRMYHPEVVTVPSRRLAWQFVASRQSDGSILRNEEVTIFSQDQGILLEASTNAEGVLTWSLPSVDHEIQIQAFDSEFKVCHLDPVGQLYECIDPTKNGKHSFDLSEFVRDQHRRQKIDFLLKRQVVSTINYENEKSWVAKPDHTVELEDYEEVESLAELCKLVLTPLRFSMRAGHVSWRMINPEYKPFFQGPPLFIIDRSLTQGDSLATHIDMRHVKKVDFYNGVQKLRYFGKRGQNGVVSITTHLSGLYRKEGKFLRGLDRRTGGIDRNSHRLQEQQPDIDPLVYWNPQVRLRDRHSLRTSLKLNDNIGSYIVQVLATAADGKMGLVSKKIVVLP